MPCNLNTHYLPAAGYNIKQDASGSQDNVQVGNSGYFGTVGDINAAVTGSDQDKADLQRKMIRVFATHPEDLISIATNPAISDGARAFAISALKVMHAGPSHYKDYIYKDHTGSTNQSNTIGGDDHARTDNLRGIGTDRFNELSTDEKLTQFEQQLFGGMAVDPQRLRATLEQLMPDAAARATN